jgi:hypothetical protein
MKDHMTLEAQLTRAFQTRLFPGADIFRRSHGRKTKRAAARAAPSSSGPHARRARPAAASVAARNQARNIATTNAQARTFGARVGAPFCSASRGGRARQWAPPRSEATPRRGVARAATRSLRCCARARRLARPRSGGAARRSRPDEALCRFAFPSTKCQFQSDTLFS